jgi:formiminotetrahydrofolate cyclodeaminase
MDIKKSTIQDFLAELASKKPVPGGGSASALSGAMAASLVVMVAQFTIGKEKYQQHEAEIKKIKTKALKLKEQLLDQADSDAEAYQKVMVTKGGQEAVLEAAEVPLATAEKSLEILKMAAFVSENGNQNLRSDAFVAMELAQAAIYGALENVRVNLPDLNDEKVVRDLKDKVDALLKATGSLVKF